MKEVTMISEEQARQLQGEIMAQSHKFKKDLKIEFGSANRMAAKAVAEAHGYSSAAEMQSQIGKMNWKGSSKDGATRGKRKAKGLSNGTLQLAERLGEFATANEGLLPPYWKLAQILDTTPADLRHAGDVLVTRGWTRVSRSSGFLLTAPAPAPVAPATNGTGKAAAAVQGTLLESQTDEVWIDMLNELRLLRGLWADMLNEQRQIRGLIAKLVSAGAR